jgi:hypothetical protein
MNRRFVERLAEEWEKYGKIIIAVDFDDTVSPYRYNDEQALMLYIRVWELLQLSQQTGAYIVCHTACNPDRHDEIRRIFKANLIDDIHINQTPVDLPYGKAGSKIYANIFLDDRAGLNEALDILETALYIQRGKMESKRLDYPGSLGL